MKIGRRRKYLKLYATATFTIGVGWIIKEIKKTYDNLNNVLDTSVINFLEPPKYPEFEEQYEDANLNYINIPDINLEPKQNTWKTLKFLYARQILKWANSNTAFVRRTAVKYLSTFSKLDDWHYSYLSQQINPKTAVTLARTKNVDNRYFPKPPFRYLNYTYDMLVYSMKDLLTALNDEAPHSCMEYFINKALEQDPAHHFIEQESTSELRKLIKSAPDILPLCLESLLHHVSLGNNACDIMNLDGLPLLIEIYNRFQNDMDIKHKLCNILAFVSMYPNALQELYRTGWIPVLAEWLNDGDVELSCTAAKILANLDDNKYNAFYESTVHLLYPLWQIQKNAAVDVVFVHGLLGGVFFTWRQRRRKTKLSGLFKNGIFNRNNTDVQLKLLRTSDPLVREYIQDAEVKDQYDWNQVGHDFEFVLNDIPTDANEEAKGPYSCTGANDCVSQALHDCCTHTMCWPRDWLANDCPDLRILGVNYDTSLSMWAQICPNEKKKCTIEERSDEFLESLLKAGVGDRPIVWITHSMGGLIVKNLLWKALNSNSKDYMKVCLNSKAIIFYSTPHTGSRAANLNSPTSLILWPSVEIQELREDSEGLHKIQENFLKFLDHVPMKVISFVETKSTLVTPIKFNLLFVDSRSGNPTIGEYFEIPQDHLGICKPASRMSFLYHKILHLVQEVVDETKAANQFDGSFD